MTQKQAKLTILTAEKLMQCVVGLGTLSLLGTGAAFAQAPAIFPDESAVPAPGQPTELVPANVPPVPPVPPEFSSGVAVPSKASTPTQSDRPPSGASAYDAPSAIILNGSTGCPSIASDGADCAGGAIAPAGYAANAVPQTGAGSLPNLSAVSIGPVAAQSGGIGLGTTPSVRDYYRRTLRPPGQLGNGNIRLIFPLSVPAAISSLFGWRMHPISGDARFHTGTDLAAPLGTPVVAAYAGRVALADFLGGYGLAVAVDHNQGTQQTLYGHLSEVFVRSGDAVKQGDVLGRVGSTGNSTGPHLHFEFRQLTPEGWVAMDSGAQLEYALAQLVKTMDFAEARSTATQASIGVAGVIQAQSPTPTQSSRSPIANRQPPSPNLNSSTLAND
jgi:murein DD-endopeptidase MepM/ murein hydrolase activator NlpD